jgi:hypothetical protein
VKKTSGLLPIDVVLEANKHPYNLRNGVSKQYDLFFSGISCDVTLGNNLFYSRYKGYGTIMVPISVDNISLIRFTLGDKHLFLTMNILDEANKPILQIDENHLVYSTSPRDIEFAGRNLIIREAKSNILIDFSFETPNKIRINRGRLLCNGVEIVINPYSLTITNNGLSFNNCVWVNCQGGLFIGPHPNLSFPIGIRIENVTRFVEPTNTV